MKCQNILLMIFLSNVVDITKLGLMELTRKKKEKSLEEIVNEKKDDN